jgi:hypothetical protein
MLAYNRSDLPDHSTMLPARLVPQSLSHLPLTSCQAHIDLQQVRLVQQRQRPTVCSHWDHKDRQEERRQNLSAHPAAFQP